MKEYEWNHGQKKELADLCGIGKSYLSDILHGRSRATPELATKLEKASRTMGLNLNRFDVLYPHESISPLILVDDDDAENDIN